MDVSSRPSEERSARRPEPLHDPSASSDRGDIFATTCWTVVVAAAERSTPQSERALEEICRTYWFPVYAYIRRRGRSKEDAEDLAQEFFRQLLEGHWIEDVDRAKGRLRAFLITALKHFLAKEWRHDTAQKRGGGRPHLSLDTRTGEARYAAAGAPHLAAEATFDRQWALILLQTALRRLEQECACAGRDRQFEMLKQELVVSHESLAYSRIATNLNLSEGAARVAVHRLRKRFRELYREEVIRTLPLGLDVNEELNYLAETLIQA